jgi:hypothetical protein
MGEKLRVERGLASPPSFWSASPATSCSTVWLPTSEVTTGAMTQVEDNQI